MKPKKRKFNPEDSLEAQWCYDSHTGEEVLINTKTNKEIMRRDRQIHIKPLFYVIDCLIILSITVLIGLIMYAVAFGRI